jgi:hypothetical protein
MSPFGPLEPFGGWSAKPPHPQGDGDAVALFMAHVHRAVNVIFFSIPAIFAILAGPGPPISQAAFPLARLTFQFHAMAWIGEDEKRAEHLT